MADNEQTNQDKIDELKRQQESIQAELRSLYEDQPEPTGDLPDIAADMALPIEVEGDTAADIPETPASMPDADQPDLVTDKMDLADAVDQGTGPHDPEPHDKQFGLADEQEMRKLADETVAEDKQKAGQQREGRNLDLEDAYAVGVRDDQQDDLRETDDLATNMSDYNRQLVGLLRTMQEIMLDGISETDSIIARFHRVL